MKNTAKFIGGLVLALLLLWWVLRDTDPGVVWQQLQQVSVVGLFLGAGLMFSHNLFRIWRWRALLEPVRKGVPFRSLFVAVVLGYTVSFTVPGRLGELVRPVLLSGREGIPLGPCLGSVIADRLMDILAILLLFSCGTLLTPLEGEAARHVTLIRGSSVTLMVVIAIPFILLLVLANSRPAIHGWLQNRRGPLAWVIRSVLAVSRGTEALVQPRLLALICFHSLMAWIVVALGGWVAVRACGADITYSTMLVIQPLLVLGIALPTPGGTGGYHAAMTMGLSQLANVDYQLAVTTSFLLHLASVIPVILVGAVIILLDRGILQNLRQVTRQVGELGSRKDARERQALGADGE